MEANWKESVFYDGSKQLPVPAGSFVSTYQSVSDDCGLTVKQVRDAFRHLQNLCILASNRAGNFQIVTLTNYKAYQFDEPLTGQTEVKTRGRPNGRPGSFHRADQENPPCTPLQNQKNVEERTNVNGAHDANIPQCSVRSFDEQKEFLRNALVSYFDGRMGEPDDELIIRVLKAGRGASAEEIQAVLKRCHQNGQAPNYPNGPKTWGWFPVVIGKHFSKTKGAVA